MDFRCDGYVFGGTAHMDAIPPPWKAFGQVLIGSLSDCGYTRFGGSGSQRQHREDGRRGRSRASEAVVVLGVKYTGLWTLLISSFAGAS
jgi:hypothetical protein